MVGNGCHPEKGTGSTHFSNCASFIIQLCPPPPHHRLSRVRCHSVVLFAHIDPQKTRASQLIASLTPSCTLSYQLGPPGTPVIREKGVQSSCSNFFVCLPGSKMASRSLAGPPPPPPLGSGRLESTSQPGLVVLAPAFRSPSYLSTFLQKPY